MTLEELASDLGLDVATIDPAKKAKVTAYLTEADSKYASASQAQKDAQTALDAVKNEQAAIDDRIRSFSVSEAELDGLKARYAGLQGRAALMEGQLKSFKTGGYNVDIPPAIVDPTPPPFDPNRFQSDVNNTLVSVFNVMNRYSRLYGKAMPDDADALAREAKAHNMHFTDWAAQKYDFQGEEKRQSEKATQADKDAYATVKVKEYQDAHPVTAGNHELTPGGASRFPELAKRPVPQKHENFGGSPAQRIARSVKRSLEGLAAAS